MSSYPIAHKCSDFVIVVLLFHSPAASARGALSRLLRPVQLNFMQAQFLCQASREVQFCHKALSKKDHRPRGSAEGTAPCQPGRAQGFSDASRLAPTMAPRQKVFAHGGIGQASGSTYGSRCCTCSRPTRIVPLGAQDLSEVLWVGMSHMHLPHLFDDPYRQALPLAHQGITDMGG